MSESYFDSQNESKNKHRSVQSVFIAQTDKDMLMNIIPT